MKQVALRDRVRTLRETGRVQLGWLRLDKARIAWLWMASRLIETGRCGSYLEARRLIPIRSWSRARLAGPGRLRIRCLCPHCRAA